MTTPPRNEVRLVTDCPFQVHPVAQKAFAALQRACVEDFAAGKTRTFFRPFEAYRSAEDQEAARARGASKAKAWQSAHQVGLAVDFVPYSASIGWNWDENADYAYLRAAARRFGLDVPITWDRVHVEHPAWAELKAALRSRK